MPRPYQRVFDPLSDNQPTSEYFSVSVPSSNSASYSKLDPFKPQLARQKFVSSHSSFDSSTPTETSTVTTSTATSPSPPDLLPTLLLPGDNSNYTFINTLKNTMTFSDSFPNIADLDASSLDLTMPTNVFSSNASLINLHQSQLESQPTLQQQQQQPTPLFTNPADLKSNSTDRISINHFPLLSTPVAPITITSSNLNSTAVNTDTTTTTLIHTNHNHNTTTAAPLSTQTHVATHTPFTATIMPSVIPPPTTISDEAVAQIVSNTSVPEFLYQLTKMLTDDHREIIEWSNGKIEVHNPHRLERDVLNKYFRHSKYASFQRQLNYFGFRKLAGKGKMAPCSYVNENATADLRSLLRMKRKTSATTKEKERQESAEKMKKQASQNVTNTTTGSASIWAHGVKRSRGDSNSGNAPQGPVAKIAVGKGVRHQLNGYLRNPGAGGITANGMVLQKIPQPTSGAITIASVALPSAVGSLDPTSIAKSAVGKGVAHHFTLQSANNTNTSVSSSTAATSISTRSSSNSLDGFKQFNNGTGKNFTFLDPSQLGMGIENIETSLSELQNNFQSSLGEHDANVNNSGGTGTITSGISNNGGSMKRDSSLVALAMIPSLHSIEPVPVPAPAPVEEQQAKDDQGVGGIMSFIDFPDSDQIGMDITNSS